MQRCLATITSVGNAGFKIRIGETVLFIDAFYDAIPGVADPPALLPSSVSRANVILVSHPHPDHFNSKAVAEVAATTGAVVMAPPGAVRRLEGLLPPRSLIRTTMGRRPGMVTARQAWPWGTVTAFCTVHGQEHNSYLLEVSGFRCFHDGDNEDTRTVPASSLAPLDVLMLGPWQGSGWVEWIEELRPAQYVLMHLTAEEREQHAAGRFLPAICDRVPMGLRVLAPGESCEFGVADPDRR